MNSKVVMYVCRISLGSACTNNFSRLKHNLMKNERARLPMSNFCFVAGIATQNMFGGVKYTMALPCPHYFL